MNVRKSEPIKVSSKCSGLKFSVLIMNNAFNVVYI